MAEDRSGLYLISIVAVVAVVGLVTIFLRGGEASSASAAGSELVPVLDEEGNVVGEATRSVSTRMLISRVGLPQAPPITLGQMCRDSDVSYAESDRPNQKGSVRYWDSVANVWSTVSDRCVNENAYVVENYCVDGGARMKLIFCEGGCEDSACVSP